MENIEFRVWDKKNKRYLSKVDNPVVVYDTGETAVRVGNPCGGEVELLYSGNYEIELFTGLFDKNGQKIYVGDIIDYNDDGECIGYVVYNAPSFEIMEEDGLICWLKGGPHQRVIGNIHENLKLLKEEK